MGLEKSRSGIDLPGIENAIRHLGRQTHGILIEIIEHGLEDPTGTTGTVLAPLTSPLEVVAEWTTKERALALWALIEEGVRDRSVGLTARSRKRHALSAGLRLPVEGISTDSWGGSLSSRFKQLKAFPAVFDSPSTTQPMEVAWSGGVKALAAYLGRWFAVLRTAEEWERFRPHDQPAFDLGEWIIEHDDRATREHAILRRASDQAQKVFAELIIVTVYMRGRLVHRRVTERLITCRDPEGDFQYYTAHGYGFGDDTRRTYVPVRSVWGCREEIVEPSRAGHVPVTRLWFPRPLRYGDQAYFASEAVFDQVDDYTDGSFYVDVEIDHLGVARGRLLYGQKLPIRGLTVRVKFDEDVLPEAVWWYAERTESERYIQPDAGDRRLVSLVGSAVRHTFTEHVCQPREHYGLAYSWPART